MYSLPSPQKSQKWFCGLWHVHSTPLPLANKHCPFSIVYRYYTIWRDHLNPDNKTFLLFIIMLITSILHSPFPNWQSNISSAPAPKPDRQVYLKKLPIYLYFQILQMRQSVKFHVHEIQYDAVNLELETLRSDIFPKMSFTIFHNEFHRNSLLFSPCYWRFDIQRFGLSRDSGSFCSQMLPLDIKWS